MSIEDTPLSVATTPDSDGQFLLYFLRDGATFKCGYIFANAVQEVRLKLGEFCEAVSNHDSGCVMPKGHRSRHLDINGYAWFSFQSEEAKP